MGESSQGLCGDRRRRRRLFDKALAADGRYVSSVHKTMDISILDAHILCHFDSGKKMLDVRMYAAVGKQSHYMQTLTVEFCIIHSVNKSRIGKEIADSMQWTETIYGRE